jgi:GDP-L-fucose synthase
MKKNLSRRSLFYNGQNVVVLGGAGFVGRHLCRVLADRGAEVYVIDNLSRHYTQLERPNLDGHETFKLNITTDSRSLLNVIEYCSPFAVFNLAAAVAGVEYNQKHHNQMFLDNVQLQTIPVMVCEQLRVPHFLQVSSACVYGEDANAPAHEGNLGGEPVGANAGYSWAKRMGERAIQWSNLKHAVIVRPSNIYGPGDWYDERAHVIPKLIEGHIKRTAKIFDGGKTIREFLYIEDVVCGMLHALEHGADKKAYNLGGHGMAVSMADLHISIMDILKSDYVPPDVSSEFDPGDDVRFSDKSKMATLGWDATTPLYDGLKKTIEGYFENA